MWKKHPLLLCGLATSFLVCSFLNAEELSFKPTAVYTDDKAKENHFFPTGLMGDHSSIVYHNACSRTPHSGSTCILIIYQNMSLQGLRWAGLYWQNPPYNWGYKKGGGLDLTGAAKLTFWARGEHGGEVIETFQVGGIRGAFKDSDTASIGPVVLTTEWKKYEIDLQGKDLSRISGGFCWTTNLDVNPNGAIFYLDDIWFE